MVFRNAVIVLMAMLPLTPVTRAVPIAAPGLERFNAVPTGEPLDQIRKLIQEKKFDEAMSAAEALDVKSAGDPDVLVLKGTIYAARGDFDKARQSFLEALALKPGWSAALSSLAQLDLREGKPRAARKRYEAILAKDQTNLDGLLGLASVAAATGQETEQVAWLNKAIKAHPSESQPRVLLATYYVSKGNPKAALPIARDARNADPNNPAAVGVLGDAQLAAGDSFNALSTYRNLVALSPDDPEAYYKLAEAQAVTRDTASARASLEKALALKPDHLASEMALASLDLAEHHPADALKIARLIQTQYPNATAGFGLEGDILMAQGEFSLAVASFEKAWQINKNGFIAIKIHQALSGEGRVDEADSGLLQWLAGEPADFVARGYLAASYAKRGRYKQAIEQYRLVLKTDPRNIVALNDLAWLYQQEKDSRALETAEQAHKLAPDNPRVMDTLGWILIQQGNTAQGLPLLRAAADKAPSSEEIRYHLAAALAQSGDKAGAREQVEKLLMSAGKASPYRDQANALLKGL